VFYRIGWIVFWLPLIARVRAGRLQGAGQIGVEVGKVITRYKTGKHFQVR
jgi:hypothetical protein